MNNIQNGCWNVSKFKTITKTEEKKTILVREREKRFHQFDSVCFVFAHTKLSIYSCNRVNLFIPWSKFCASWWLHFDLLRTNFVPICAQNRSTYQNNRDWIWEKLRIHVIKKRVISYLILWMICSLHVAPLDRFRCKSFQKDYSTAWPRPINNIPH